MPHVFLATYVTPNVIGIAMPPAVQATYVTTTVAKRAMSPVVLATYVTPTAPERAMISCSPGDSYATLHLAFLVNISWHSSFFITTGKCFRTFKIIPLIL